MAIGDGTGHGRLMPLGMRMGNAVANEAEEKARTQMVDGSTIIRADGAMPDDSAEQAYDMGVSAAESLDRAIKDGLKTRAEILAMSDDEVRGTMRHWQAAIEAAE